MARTSISDVPGKTYVGHPCLVNGEIDWALETMIIPHSAARMATHDLLAGVQGMKPVTPKKAKLLQGWYKDYYLSYVMHHHDNEEKLYFPFLNEVLRKKGVDPTPNKMSVQHGELVAAMAKIESGIAELVMKANQDTVAANVLADQLARTVENFTRDMFLHLNEEELFIVPAIRDHVPPEENDAMVQKIIQSLGLGGAKLSIPWIYEALEMYDPTPEKKHLAAFWAVIPPPLKFFNWVNWHAARHEQSRRDQSAGGRHHRRNGSRFLQLRTGLSCQIQDSTFKSRMQQCAENTRTSAD
mmetsp:Transcript_23274/g.58868  ORF Transcript_23274/g.58868 Transcript_23274/m.58868 type:complete len:298 (+) Transcript_23274:286-1179(+)